MYSISVTEILLTSVTGALAIVLYLAGNERSRWAFVALCCALCASVLSPADLASMLVLWIAFLCFFVFGSRFNVATSAENAEKTARQSDWGTPDSFRISIAIASLAVLVFLFSRLFVFTATEPLPAYQVFRVWSATVASAGLFATAAAVWVYSVVCRHWKFSS
ncbi:hypothetical protein NHH03_10735 [Stieleria sp. TO1_6]|uniref:hypothetical protein n=1 Tax=Stieleria tagensis TaxID=2956795 RepID=UPI00209ABC8C|nr:hypothetical protein [Stieleria tagensis]MCO8122215.1 hypothetical protein [Stieleria tagensis]